MQEILKYLKEHGERLDAEIAAATAFSCAPDPATASYLLLRAHFDNFQQVLAGEHDGEHDKEDDNVE